MYVFAVVSIDQLHPVFGMLRNLHSTISCTSVDVEALSAAAKAAVQSTGKQEVTFEEFQKVFVGEF